MKLEELVKENEGTDDRECHTSKEDEDLVR